MNAKMISGAQIRGARGMLGWSQADLALRARVAQKTVERLEAQDLVRGRTAEAIEEALIAGGIRFAENDGSVGVMLTQDGTRES